MRNCLARRQRYQKLPQSLGGGLHPGQPLAYGGILDGNLLARFLDLPAARQAELAGQAGCDGAALVQLVKDVERAVRFF